MLTSSKVKTRTDGHPNTYTDRHFENITSTALAGGNYKDVNRFTRKQVNKIQQTMYRSK